EGGVLGAVLGAAIGSSVGRGTAACTTPYQGQYGSYGAYPEPAPYGYDRSAYGYGDYDRGYDEYGYGYQGGYGSGYGQPVNDGRAGDGCQLSESRITLPDGRQDVRYV